MKKIIQYFTIFLLLLVFQQVNGQTTALENNAEAAIKKEAEVKKSLDKVEKKYKKAEKKLKKAKKDEEKFNKQLNKMTAEAAALRTKGLDSGDAEVLKKADKAKAKNEKLAKKLDKATKNHKKRQKDFDKIASKYKDAQKDWEKAKREKEKAMNAMKG